MNSEVTIRLTSGIDIYEIPEDSNSSMVVSTETTVDNLKTIVDNLLNIDEHEYPGQRNWIFFHEDFLIETSLEAYFERNPHVTSENELLIKFFVAPEKNEPESIGECPDAVLQICKYKHYAVVLGARSCLSIFDLTKLSSLGKPLAIVRSSETGVLRVVEISEGKFFGMTSAGVCVHYDVETAIQGVATSAEPVFVSNVPERITYFAVSNDLKRIALGGQGGGIFLVNFEDSLDTVAVPTNASGKKRSFTGMKNVRRIQPSLTVNAHCHTVTGIIFIENAAEHLFSILSTSLDSNVVCTDYIDGSKLWGFNSGKAITCVAYDMKSSFIYTAHIDGKIKQWVKETASFNNTRIYTPSTTGIIQIGINSCKKLGGLITVTCNDGTIALYNPMGTQAVQKLNVTRLSTLGRPELGLMATAFLYLEEKLLIGTSLNDLFLFSL